MKKKIALIGYRLNKGGAERVLTTLSIFFENQGIEVHNIIIIDDMMMWYVCGPVSPSTWMEPNVTGTRYPR